MEAAGNVTLQQLARPAEWLASPDALRAQTSILALLIVRRLTNKGQAPASADANWPRSTCPSARPPVGPAGAAAELAVAAIRGS